MTAVRDRTEYAYVDVIWDGKSDARISYQLKATSSLSYEEFIRFGIYKKGFHENFDSGNEPSRTLNYGYTDGQNTMKANISVEEYGSFGMNPTTDTWYTYKMKYSYGSKTLTIQFVDNEEEVVFAKSFENILFEFETNERELGFFSEKMRYFAGNPFEKVVIRNLQYYFLPSSVKPYLREDEIKLYPNPTPGKFTIDIDGVTANEIEVAIYRIDGSRIFQKTYLPTEQLNIDLSNKVSGMYLIQIITDDQQVVKKLILDKK